MNKNKAFWLFAGNKTFKNQNQYHIPQKTISLWYLTL